MQTPYEVVKNAIYFQKPDRLPLQFESLGMNDTHSVSWNQTGVGDRTLRSSVDEWGCRWERSEFKNMGQVVGHPLDDWSKLASFRWPDADSSEFYAGMEAGFEGSEDKYVTTGVFMLLFERMHSLRGFENTLTDLYLERERIEELADRIVEYDIRIIENIASRFPGRIHGFSFTDDWGTELASFISRGLWDEFFRPRYKKIFDAAKKAGWDVLMHSCGKINELIPSLIEIGCQVLNMQQPTTNGIEEIGRQFAGKVCFSSLCDIQHSLPFKSDEELDQEARDLLTCWGTDDGGFILSDYGDGAAIGVDEAKKKFMLAAFLEHDRWKGREN